MNNKILVAGLVGAATAFLLGFLTWGLALSGFMESNAGTATGVMKEQSEIWMDSNDFGAHLLGYPICICFWSLGKY